MERKPLEFSYDPIADIITIEGIKYTGDLFRCLGFPDTKKIYKFKCVDSSKLGRTLEVEALSSKKLSDLMDFIND